MQNATIHTLETAPEASRPYLRGSQKAFGFIPNLLATLAESPAALEGYLAAAGALSKSSLTATEQQVVLLAVSIENGCEYCVAAHTYIARGQGVAPSVLEDLRANRILSDSKLAALVEFARAVVVARGFVSEAQQRAFLDAGYSNQDIFAVLMGVTQKTLSNYSNHITRLPLDPEFAQDAWVSESQAAQ